MEKNFMSKFENVEVIVRNVETGEELFRVTGIDGSQYGEEGKEYFKKLEEERKNFKWKEK